MSCQCPIRSGFHCAKCHAYFTGVESFDRHQTLDDSGVTCRDPATFELNGKRVFQAYRTTREGKPMWGRYRPDLPQREFPAGV